MTSCGDMVVVFAARLLLISLLSISTVFGCGQLAQGQERNMSFTVTGFTLPVAMIYTEDAAVRAQLPGVPQSRQAATTFVTGLIMQSVNDVLEQEGRSAGLLPGVIALILQQLTVQINYDPLKCDVVFVNPTGANMIDMAKMENCIIFGNTVTAICRVAAGVAMCTAGNAMNLFSVPAQHLTISGSLRITNPIMASWSRQMWQSILIRVARNLASGPFRANFISASVTVG